MYPDSDVDDFIAKISAALRSGRIGKEQAQIALLRALACSITGRPDFRALAREMGVDSRPPYVN